MTRASGEPRIFQSLPEDSDVVGRTVGSACSSGTAVGAEVGSGSVEPPQATMIPTAKNEVSKRREAERDPR